MTLVPIAAFLAGALLSLLIPALLLLALVAWYVMFLKRIPHAEKPAEKPQPAPSPGPSGAPEAGSASGDG